MDVEAALVPDGQTAEAMKPCERPLHDPAVSAQALARLHSAPGDPRGDATVSASPSAAGVVVAFVSMEFGRSLARRPGSTAHRLHTVEQILEPLGVVLVRRPQLNGHDLADRPSLFEVSGQLPGSRVLDGRPGIDPHAMVMPKGRDAGLAYARQFIESAKVAGVVKAAIDRAGMRGAVVAPLE